MLAPMRFSGPATVASISDIITNLVPYPRIHNVFPSLAKFTPESTYPIDGNETLDNLMQSVFTKDTQLCDIDPR